MITLTRDSGYADRLRKYQVILDGKVIGEIGNGETKSFETQPGNHALWLTIDWCRSNPVDFVQQSDENVEFVCSSPLRGWRVFLAIFYITGYYDRYINLARR